jgi:hypothetical protein
VVGQTGQWGARSAAVVASSCRSTVLFFLFLLDTKISNEDVFKLGKGLFSIIKIGSKSTIAVFSRRFGQELTCPQLTW